MPWYICARSHPRALQHTATVSAWSSSSFCFRVGQCRAGMIAQAGIQAKGDCVQMADQGFKLAPLTKEGPVLGAGLIFLGFGPAAINVSNCGLPLSNVCVAASVLMWHAACGFLLSNLALACPGNLGAQLPGVLRIATICQDTSRSVSHPRTPRDFETKGQLSCALRVLQLQSTAQAMICR